MSHIKVNKPLIQNDLKLCTDKLTVHMFSKVNENLG